MDRERANEAVDGRGVSLVSGADDQLVRADNGDRDVLESIDKPGCRGASTDTSIITSVSIR
jgi:hypothetical protein